jgi:putative acetyltransferase
MMVAMMISAVDPLSSPARSMSDALWAEIQERYGFIAPNPVDHAAFVGPVGAFWVAIDEDRPVGSIAVSPMDTSGTAEVDVMYVAPGHRGTGLAQALLAALEDHARAAGVTVVRLRAGEPQPEALRFYAAAGFTPIPPFGRWVHDETARCLEKVLR